MDMAHVSEETMCQFLEFCYTGDYSELGEEPESPEPSSSGIRKFLDEKDGACEEEEKEEEEELYPPSEQLLPNAKLYVLADMYNIPRLKDLAFGKLTARIVEIGYCHGEGTDAFIRLFKYAFENLPEREEMDQLLEYLGKYTAWALNMFREDEDFLNLFAGNYRVDFIKLILGNLQECNSAPWHPDVFRSTYSPCYIPPESIVYFREGTEERVVDSSPTPTF